MTRLQLVPPVADLWDNRQIKQFRSRYRVE